MCAAKLKSCPFCGSVNLYTQSGVGEFWILCGKCKASSGMQSCQEYAFAAWNSRAELEEKSPIVQQLKAEILLALEQIKGAALMDERAKLFMTINETYAKLSAV